MVGSDNSPERTPTIARWVPGALPQVHRLHVPATLVRERYPEEHDGGEAPDSGGAGAGATG